MTTPDESPTTLVSSLNLLMAIPQQPGYYIPLTALLSYRVSDPYAVSLAFEVDTYAPPVIWTFARDLLREQPTVQNGDVRVWPAPDANGEMVVHIEVSSPAGYAHFITPAAAIDEFVRWTADLVPFGAESSFTDIDAELSALLGGS